MRYRDLGRKFTETTVVTKNWQFFSYLGLRNGLVPAFGKGVNFASKFCERYGIAPEHYEAKVLELSLYPAARIFRGTLGLIPQYFAADRDFIRSVGRMTRRQDFAMEEMDFVQNHENRGLLRRRFKLRVSARRLHQLVREILEEPKGARLTEGQSMQPWVVNEKKMGDLSSSERP